MTSGPDLKTTADLIAALGPPPRPLPPQIKIADDVGRPTADYHRWMTQQHEWLKRLAEIVGGIV